MSDWEEKIKSEKKKNGWNELFKNKIVGPVAIGCIIGLIGIFTPYEYEFGWVGFGCALIGYYFWFRDI